MRNLVPVILIIAGVILLHPFSVAKADVDSQRPGVGNETCLQCHSVPGIGMNLANDQWLSLYVNPDIYNSSIHGQQGYACIQCHTDLGEYPHPSFSAADRRDVSLQLSVSCKRCHSGQYEATLDSVHDRAMSTGNRQAAICIDCHGSHNMQRLTDPETHNLLPTSRIQIPQTCARCHNLIYEKYSTSVHGEALLKDGNEDVPTCTDCHGVHDIEDPTTAAFRIKSPKICAECHTNPEMMDKYGLSIEVFNTYVADFHGTTITLFENLTPDAESNKPVCFDCHGVHDIKRVDDPEIGLAVRENLLARCRVCHPDATANFSDAWLSHYIPSQSKNQVVYYVNLFYKFFIPGTLGGMALLVALDLSVKIRNHKRPKNGKRPPAEVMPEDRLVTAEEGPIAEKEVGSTEIPSQSIGTEPETEKEEHQEPQPDSPNQQSNLSEGSGEGVSHG